MIGFHYAHEWRQMLPLSLSTVICIDCGAQKSLRAMDRTIPGCFSKHAGGGYLPSQPKPHVVPK